MLEGLNGELPAQERADRDDPRSLARLATRAELRRPGTLERSLRRRRSARPGAGGLLAGSFLNTVAAVVVGTAIADAIFADGSYAEGYQDGAEAAGADQGADAATPIRRLRRRRHSRCRHRRRRLCRRRLRRRGVLIPARPVLGRGAPEGATKPIPAGQISQTDRCRSHSTGVETVDMKLEVVVVPVSDVDRAKGFYESLGWRLDADFVVGAEFRVVQLTPPGSECSIIFGTGSRRRRRARSRALQLTVFDIEAARAELAGRGVDVSEVFHDVGGMFHHAGTEGRAPGPDPERGATTARSPRSATRTATAGSSKRCGSGLRDGDGRGPANPRPPSPGYGRGKGERSKTRRSTMNTGTETSIVRLLEETIAVHGDPRGRPTWAASTTRSGRLVRDLPPGARAAGPPSPRRRARRDPTRRVLRRLDADYRREQPARAGPPTTPHASARWWSARRGSAAGGTAMIQRILYGLLALVPSRSCWSSPAGAGTRPSSSSRRWRWSPWRPCSAGRPKRRRSTPPEDRRAPQRHPGQRRRTDHHGRGAARGAGDRRQSQHRRLDRRQRPGRPGGIAAAGRVEERHPALRPPCRGDERDDDDPGGRRTGDPGDFALGAAEHRPSERDIELLSDGVAVVLIAIYALYLLYSLVQKSPGEEAQEHHGPATMGLRVALGILVASTVAIVFISEFLVGALEPTAEDWGLSELFVGVMLVPLVGNVAEHLVAVKVAVANKMDLSLGIAVGSGLQIALFVTPLLVFAGILLDQPMTLVFNPFELSALVAASLIAVLISVDGESNWLEGAELLALHLGARHRLLLRPLRGPPRSLKGAGDRGSRRRAASVAVSLAKSI